MSRQVVVVTGSTGFIASHIVEELLSRGYTVRGTVRSLSSNKNDHLKKMKRADELLELVQLDMTDPYEKFVQAFKGCDLLIHTASPFSLDVNDPQKELVDPAVNGTLNALKAAVEVKIKKVILTSSVAAITDEPIDGKIFSEEDWNNQSSLTRNPYYYSKACQEKAAWNFVKQLPEENRIKFISMNPFMVIGPSHSKIQGINESCSTLHGLIIKKFNFIVDLHWGFVDVRDVAVAHAVVLENENASGRYILVNPNGMLTMRETIELLKKYFPNYEYPGIGLDNAVGNVIGFCASFFQKGQVGVYMRTVLGGRFVLNSEKSQKELGIKYTNIDKTLVDTINSFIQFNFIPDKRTPNAPTPAPASNSTSSSNNAANPSLSVPSDNNKNGNKEGSTLGVSGGKTVVGSGSASISASSSTDGADPLSSTRALFGGRSGDAISFSSAKKDRGDEGEEKKELEKEEKRVQEEEKKEVEEEIKEEIEEETKQEEIKEEEIKEEEIEEEIKEEEIKKKEETKEEIKEEIKEEEIKEEEIKEKTKEKEIKEEEIKEEEIKEEEIKEEETKQEEIKEEETKQEEIKEEIKQEEKKQEDNELEEKESEDHKDVS